MGTEENENKAVSLTDEPLLEITQEEPIEQVMTQDTTDNGTAEYSDQEAFEETAKLEEVERKPSISKRKTVKKAAKPDSKLISDLHDRLRKSSNAGKKTDMTIRDIQKKIKDLDKRTSSTHHQIIRDLQTQVNELRRKIDRIERSSRSKSNISIKKTSSKKNKDKSKKNAKKKTRRR